MLKDSADHGQAMCRWFAYPLGVYKAAHPLNGLSRLKTRHNGPSLGLIHSESNWSNVEKAADTLRVQLDLNTSNGGNDRTTESICSPQIKCTHQSRENRLRNRNYWQLTHPNEEALKSEMLQLGEIDTSP